ncbi:hypothetical protein [Kribbella sp. NPDC055071]
MSSLLRPVGHLPASVYWFRRGLVLAVVVLLFFLVSRLVPGGGDADNTAASGPQPNPSGAPVGPTATPSATPKTTEKKSDKTTEPTKTSPPADKKCAGSDVTIAVLPGSRKVVSGSILNFVVQLNAVSDECKATVDSTQLVLTVQSGKDLIWTTTHCGKAILAATLVVAKGKQAATTIGWSGQRSGPGCLPGQPVAKPGTYTVKAEFDGRASAAQAFQIV